MKKVLLIMAALLILFVTIHTGRFIDNNKSQNNIASEYCVQSEETEIVNSDKKYISQMDVTGNDLDKIIDEIKYNQKDISYNVDSKGLYRFIAVNKNNETCEMTEYVDGGYCEDTEFTTSGIIYCN